MIVLSGLICVNRFRVWNRFNRRHIKIILSNYSRNLFSELIFNLRTLAPSLVLAFNLPLIELPFLLNTVGICDRLTILILSYRTLRFIDRNLYLLFRIDLEVQFLVAGKLVIFNISIRLIRSIYIYIYKIILDVFTSTTNFNYILKWLKLSCKSIVFSYYGIFIKKS